MSDFYVKSLLFLVLFSTGTLLLAAPIALKDIELDIADPQPFPPAIPTLFTLPLDDSTTADPLCSPFTAAINNQQMIDFALDIENQLAALSGITIGLITVATLTPHQDLLPGACDSTPMSPATSIDHSDYAAFFDNKNNTSEVPLPKSAGLFAAALLLLGLKARANQSKMLKSNGVNACK